MLEVCKDGKEYLPKSLYTLVCCLVTFDAEMKRLDKLELGNSSKQAEPITPAEEALLWTRQQFGTHCVMVLINIVYY